jgi:1-acyl-sn-glycerol-3-phosphate acyltransferase
MTYQISRKTHLNRVIVRAGIRLIFHTISRIRITGRQNIPETGPYLIAINHVSLYDPPFVICFWPTIPEAVGAAEIWSKKGQSTLARLYGGIPIRRGQYDRDSLERVLSALRSGRSLVIAPEGTRSHQPGLQRAQPGIAFILEHYPVPVLPVGIVGTTEDLIHKGLRAKRPQLEINIGEKIVFEPYHLKGEAKKQERQKVADQIMIRIAELLPESYRGIYTNQEFVNDR